MTLLCKIITPISQLFIMKCAHLFLCLKTEKTEQKSSYPSFNLLMQSYTILVLKIYLVNREIKPQNESVHFHSSYWKT